MESLEFNLPYPPSVNHYWRWTRRGVYISNHGVAFRNAVIAILQSDGVRPISGCLVISIELHPPDDRRRDVDNIIKPLLDALQHGGAYHDDSQIVELTVRKCHKKKPGIARVTITKYDSASVPVSRR